MSSILRSLGHHATLLGRWRPRLLVACLVCVSACDFIVHDQLPATPRTEIVPPPAPESAGVAVACDTLGYELGVPGMSIGAGRATIALPSRARRIEISAPGTLNQSDTEYVLIADVSAPGTAFVIAAGDITLNLNGHRVTYGTAGATGGNSYGVQMSAWGSTGVVIANGEIYQGDGACAGDIYGGGCNPVWSAPGTREIGGLELAWHTPDTGGIFLPEAPNVEIHHNTLIDSGNVVTYAGTGVPAIRNELGAGSSIHHNKILTRHRGIHAGSNSITAYNEIHINSYQSNSFGVMLYQIQNFEVHHNKIYGLGVHPMGFGPIAEGGADGRMYSNYVIVENTRSVENATDIGGGFGMRITWGGDRLEAMCNYFVVKGGNTHPELNYPTQPRSWGRALWLGGIAEGHSANIHHNYVQALNSDGNSYVAGVAIVSPGHNGGLVIQDNTVVTNHSMVVLADVYGSAGIGSPKFIRNRFIRKDAHPTFRMITDRLFGYFDVTGTFLDNIYENGAGISAGTVQMYFCTPQKAEVAVSSTINSIETVQFYLTDDPQRAAAGSSSQAFGDCGFWVVP